MAGGSKTQTKYPDLRYLFIRGLIALEKFQRTRHYLKSAAECTSKAVVSLDICEHPVKSIKQAGTLEGIGAEIKRKLQTIHEEKRFNLEAPVRGKYCSSASAILVALLEITEREIVENHSEDDCVLVEEAALRVKARQISEEKFLDNSSDGNCFCQAWWRLEVLIKRDLVKRRSLNKSPVYQLLPLGRETAHRLRGTNPLTTVTMTSTISQPITSVSESDQAAPWMVPASRHRNPEDSLYTNDTGEEGIVILIDTQEWGGDRQSLGQLCRLFEQSGIRYQSRRLKSGDYCWIWRCDGVERYLPCLVERKRADDMANSLKEGRFWKQVTKMVEWKKSFRDYGMECPLHYMVEGEPEQYVVRCSDGCQGVGKCGNPNITQVKCAFRDLKSHPELVVQTTENIESTVVLLASITAELQTRMKKGEFDEMIVKELTGDAVVQKDETNIMNDLVNVISDSSDVDDSQDVKTVQQNIRKQQTKGKDGKDQQNITCVKSSTKSLKEFNNEMGYSNEFRISNKPPNSVELDSDDNSETFLPLEPLAQYHCAGSEYVRYPGQQSEPTNHMSYHPKIKRSGDNSEHSFSKSSITPTKRKHSVRSDNSVCTYLSTSKKTPAKRKLPTNNDEMSESSDIDRNLVITPLITECNDYQRHKVFSPKTFKLNITPSMTFTESLNDYTPPSGRRKGKVKSRHNSDRYRKQSEDEIICKDDGSLNWSEFQQRCKYPVSESELLIPSHVDLLQGSYSEQHQSKFTGEHTSEFLPENLDMKSVDMNENIRNAPCSNQFLSGNKITDQCSDSDSDSLPDLHTVITNKKSHMDNYWQQELDSNKNTSQINCDINQRFLNKKKMDQMKTDNLKFNSGNEISVGLPFVDIKNNNVKPLYCENSNSVAVTKSEEDYSDKIPLIQSVLPHVTRHKARAMLIQYKGNADLCVAALLDSSSPVEGPMVDLT